MVAEPEAAAHPDFAAYRVNPGFERATEKIKEQQYDWVTHTAERYSVQAITDAGKWQQTASKEARVVEQAEGVDIGKLNEGQRRVYDVPWD